MRRKLLLAVIAVLLLGAVHTAYWFFLQRELAEGFARWAEGARRSGFRVTETSAKAGGWPFSVDLVIRDLVIEGAGGIADFEVGWRSPRTVLSLPLTNPYRLAIVPTGVQRLRAGAAPGILVDGKQLQASLAFGAGHVPESLDVAGSTLTARPAAGTPGGVARPSGGAATDQGEQERDVVSIGMVQAHCDLAGDSDGLAFASNAEAIVLPAAGKWPLGNRVSSVSVDGKLIGRLSDAATLAQWAAGWRDAGGALQVQKLSFGWGPLGVTAAATLALDDQLQPMGTGTARLIGYPAALDAMAASGTLSRSAVIATKAILSLLSSSDSDAGEVEVPLTLQYRTLSIRQVPLVRLPEVDWGPR